MKTNFAVTIIKGKVHWTFFSRKYTLFTCYVFFCPKRDVQFKQNESHFCHLGKDLHWALAVASDVSKLHVFVYLLFSSRLFFQNAEILKIAKGIKNLLTTMLAQSLWRMSKRHLITVDTSDVTGLVRLQSFPRWRKWTSFTQTQRLLSDKRNL